MIDIIEETEEIIPMIVATIKEIMINNNKIEKEKEEDKTTLMTVIKLNNNNTGIKTNLHNLHNINNINTIFIKNINTLIIQIKLPRKDCQDSKIEDLHCNKKIIINKILGKETLIKITNNKMMIFIHTNLDKSQNEK